MGLQVVARILFKTMCDGWELDSLRQTVLLSFSFSSSCSATAYPRVDKRHPSERTHQSIQYHIMTLFGRRSNDTTRTTSTTLSSPRSPTSPRRKGGFLRRIHPDHTNQALEVGVTIFHPQYAHLSCLSYILSADTWPCPTRHCKSPSTHAHYRPRLIHHSQRKVKHSVLRMS